MIYYSVFPENLNTENYEKIYNGIRPFLPEFRREKADGIIPARERAVSALSFVLLSHALSLEYPDTFSSGDLSEIAHCINFRYGENGKPFFAAPYDQIFFNISHCRTAIACAVADFEVGVDIQDIRKPSAALLKHMPYVMNEKEFSAFWTRYEAYTKLTGEGITRTMSDCDFMSDSFLKSNGVNMMSLEIPDSGADSIADDMTQKKTAAYLSAAFYNTDNSFAHIKQNKASAPCQFSCIEFSRLCNPALL